MKSAFLNGAAIAALMGTTAIAQDLSGEIVIINWLSGGEGDIFAAIEEAFEAENPGVTIRDLDLSGAGDARGAIRSALLAGETADLLVNTWPAFRQELADSGLLRPVDAAWDGLGMSANLTDSWRTMGQSNGETYGVPFTYGYRSGVWYRPETLAAAGIDEVPETLDEMVSGFDALIANDVTPLGVGAKIWAQGEVFETLLLRTAGVEVAAQLAAHDIPWTDPRIRDVLVKWSELITAGCCGDSDVMLSNDWSEAVDGVLNDQSIAYNIMGMWVNGRASGDFGLDEGVDYSLFKFPALGLGHDDTAIVDAKEVVAFAGGANPAVADAFLAFLASETAANIIAEGGLASPSSAVDAELYGPVTRVAAEAVAVSDVHFVLGDLLPGDLVDEYRVQLQRFLQNPSGDTIDSVLGAIEAKAALFD